ncbi:hypothetical protein RRF57_011740 [Xylaria bambusicola]|uniref:Uncharacterized protein n=1 Tax=Xylaria bambusicola TaxID=326684 RepID=A0AAN7UVD9_9PEZI
MDKYFKALRVNPQNIGSIDDLLFFMGSCPQEELSRYRASRLLKAKESPSLGQKAFSARFVKVLRLPQFWRRTTVMLFSFRWGAVTQRIMDNTEPSNGVLLFTERTQH